MRSQAVAGLASMTMCLAASAQTLAERESIETRTAELKAKADEVNKSCGSKLTVSLDWKGFVPHFHDTLLDKDGNEEGLEHCNKPSTPGQSTACAQNPCEVVLGGIETVCSSTYGSYGKSAVAHGITAVTCSFDASVPQHPAVTIPLTLKAGVLAARYNLRAKDTQSTMLWLTDNLPAHPAFPGAPRPLTIMERLKIGERDAELKAKVDEATASCGATFTAAVDWPSFIPHFHDVLKDEDGNEDTMAHCSNPSAAQATTCAESPCEQAIGAFYGLCRTAAGKKAVASKIRAIRCTWDGSLRHPKLGFDLKGGILTVRSNWRGANVAEQMTEFLQSNL